MTESGLATFRIEKERWARFQQLAKDSNSNASKLIISFIDACLDNRIDIDDYTITQSKSEISTSGIDDYLDNNLDTRIGNYLAKNLSSYLDNRIDELSIGELIRSSLETSLDPIRESVSKLEAIASHPVEIPAAIAKAVPLSRKTKPDADGNTKTWCEFFEMVGVEAMTAVEAQKKPVTDTRTKQIERGVQAAKDQGRGEWIARPAGRSFVRVDTKPESTLPLFPTND